jgi:hypothetical protein
VLATAVLSESASSASIIASARSDMARACSRVGERTHQYEGKAVVGVCQNAPKRPIGPEQTTGNRIRY